MNRVLLSAPYVGEIGWELMSWQARVRWALLRGGYDRLVVLGAAGKEAFYDGTALEYRPVDLCDLPGAAYEDRRLLDGHPEPIKAELIRNAVFPTVHEVVAQLVSHGEDVTVLWPGYDGTLWPCDPNHQSFVRFGTPVTTQAAEPRVVLVKRTRAFRGGTNWPVEHWRELERLLNERGVRTTVYPCEAKAAIEVLSSSDLAVGQSTGGLHLAALCGCPTMVWSIQDYLMWRWEITNRQRYETWWNPLGTPVIFREVPQLPDPQAAADQVMAALQAIGRRTGSAVHSRAFRLKWSLRTLLNDRIIRPRRYARWPWRLQKLVRYQLA